MSMSAREHRYEFSAMVRADGTVARRRNVLAVEDVGVGHYRVRLPQNRFVRAESHHVGLTLFGPPDQVRMSQIGEAVGNLIEVHTFSHDGTPADTAFMVAAERL